MNAPETPAPANAPLDPANVPFDPANVPFDGANVPFDGANAPLDGANAPLDPAFLALLCCPLCAARPPLRFDASRRLLRCDQCGHEFFFAEGDGFPDLRPPVNTPLSENA